MRDITTHHVEGMRAELTLTAMGERGPGNAYSEYLVSYGPGLTQGSVLRFQRAPQGQGLTNEILLAVVRDRLEGFQAGEYACLENENALEAVKAAMFALAVRTVRRVARGVEGTAAV